MTIRPFLPYSDRRLHIPAEPVQAITETVRMIWDDMIDTMDTMPGVGLAAPQVGVSSRLYVMDCEKDPDAPRQPIAMLNPEITWRSEALNTYEEGCLSIPDHYADVTRPAEVRIRWLGLDGKTHEREFDGLWATCAQHEMDHLDGKLFIDYLGPIKRQLITRKMVKFKRERGRDV